MANRKISDLTALTAPVTSDLLQIVDISEAAAADKNKKITYGTFLSSAPLGTAAAPSIAFTGDSNTGIYSPGADQLAIATGGTVKATVDSSGRLLVGTSSARSNFYNTTATSQFQIEGTAAEAASLAVINTASSASGARLHLAKGRGGSIGSNTIVVDGDVVGQITFQANDGTEFVESASIQAFVDGTPGANDMPGRLVFSTTADGASSPTERMSISSDGALRAFSANTVVRAFSATGAGTTEYLFGGWHSSTNIVGTGSTISFVVFTNGNVQNTNNSYGAISDAKLKENIVDATSQWNDLKALQVRKYNFKEGQTHTQIGLVAQEVELVSPGLVTESPDRDAEGNDLGTVTKSVNYSVLYMKAVKALQEAMERIETLEARLSTLEGA